MINFALEVTNLFQPDVVSSQPIYLIPMKNDAIFRNSRGIPGGYTIAEPNSSAIFGSVLVKVLGRTDV